MKAIYPGSFDPITLGHLNIIERALKIFDEVVIVVANNPSKGYMFDFHDRGKIVRDSIASINVPTNKKLTVAYTKYLVSDVAENLKADAIIRGIRNATDLDYEIKLEMYNRSACSAETVYLSPYTEHLNTSSSLVRMFLQTGKLDLASKYITEDALKFIKERKKSDL